MLNIILSGALGYMGRVITNLVAEDENKNIVCGVDKTGAGETFPVYPSFKNLNVKADVIVDFSHPSVLTDMLNFAKEKNIPLVIATSGFTDAQVEEIKEASKVIPVFFTYNMSLGVNLLTELSKKAAAVLGGFDIEIIEKHHNKKVDAPSGTAIMLANEINNAKNNSLKYEYDRHSHRYKRENNELGIHSVRGGTIVGEHEVLFCGNDEIISLKHTALSKDVFASGALSAASFIKDKPAKLYTMQDLIKE